VLDTALKASGRVNHPLGFEYAYPPPQHSLSPSADRLFGVVGCSQGLCVVNHKVATNQA